MLTVLTGRSRRLWPRLLAEIGEAYAEGDERLFLITPDQYTLQSELELVERLQLPGLLRIEVLSPSRLLTRVFTLAGSPRRVRIDARGKAMMLADVVLKAQEALVHYGGAAGRRGFADRLATNIADFKCAGMSPEDVEALAGRFPPEDALHGKLADIALLYRHYEARLQGAFLDGEDAQEALLERLPTCGLLDGSRVWIYGFDLINPQFLRQIAVMTRVAASVRLALTWEDASAPDGLSFAPARETLARLARYFDAEHMQWTHERVEAPLQTKPEIQHLETSLFALRPQAYPGAVEAIVLGMARDPYDEAMQAAAELLRYARAGMRFDEMLVVLGDAEGYAGAIETAFGRSGIPYHLARKRPALSHPLLRAWMAGLRCATRGWRSDDALDWLKGGFSGLTVEEAERLENHAIEHGLRGAKWRRAIEDEALEGIRQRFVAPLEALQTRLRKARNTTGMLTAVYTLLEDVDAHGTLAAWQQSLQARGMPAEASECAQAWRIALETLDQLHALLHGARIPMATLAQVVESGFAAAELAAVPSMPGIVQVGQLGHFKLGGACRLLFLLGMQDGILRTSSGSLISDQDMRRAAEAAGREMAFGLERDALARLVQVNLLDTLAAPTERLYISHAATGPSGDAQRPAAVLSTLRKLFPALREQGSALRRAEAWHAPGTALDAMGHALRMAVREPMPEGAEEAIAWLLHAPQTRLQAGRVLRALETPVPPARLGTRATNALYAHQRTSVSRLETFAGCPFRHFVTYGLRPIPRREFAVARDETGTFYHRAMEGYAKAAAALSAWPEINREENDALMDGVLAPLRAEWENQPLGDNAMLRATGEAFCRVARRAAWTYAGQMRRGRFRTGVVEARFGPGELLPPIALLLPDGSKRWIEGRIDRIDFLREGADTWLRVVDYKSGGTTLDPSRVHGGLQLQLLLYLTAALAAHPGVTPAGAFYARFADPLIDTDSVDVALIEEALAKDLRLKGIMLSDIRVVQAMDGGDALLKTDGTIKKTADAATEDELAALMWHAYALASEMAGQIAAGEIAARPAQLEQWRACQWCDYQGICGFDPKLAGQEARQLEKLSREALMERAIKNPHGF